MQNQRKLRSFSIALAGTAVAAGCSIVNAFDKMALPREGVYTSGPKLDEPLAEGGLADGGDAATAGAHYQVEDDPGPIRVAARGR